MKFREAQFSSICCNYYFVNLKIIIVSHFHALILTNNVSLRWWTVAISTEIETPGDASLPRCNLPRVTTASFPVQSIRNPFVQFVNFVNSENKYLWGLPTDWHRHVLLYKDPILSNTSLHVQHIYLDVFICSLSSYLINCMCEFILNELNASGWWYSLCILL